MPFELKNLNQEQTQAWLDRTRLNIAFLPFPMEKGTHHIQAAHGRTATFVCIRFEDGRFDGMLMTGAPVEERRERYHAMLRNMRDEHAAQLLTPSGKEINDPKDESP